MNDTFLYFAYFSISAAVLCVFAAYRQGRTQQKAFATLRTTSDEAATHLLRQNTLLTAQIDDLNKKLRRARRELEQLKQVGRDGDGSMPSWANF